MKTAIAQSVLIVVLSVALGTLIWYRTMPTASAAEPIPMPMAAQTLPAPVAAPVTTQFTIEAEIKPIPDPISTPKTTKHGFWWRLPRPWKWYCWHLWRNCNDLHR
jgi:hypothetical protein